MHTDGQHFGSSLSTGGSHSILDGRSKPVGISFPNGRLPQARGVYMPKLQPASQTAGNTRHGAPYAPPHIWSSSSSKEDYDKLGPATSSPEDMSVSGDVHYACTDLMRECPDLQDTSRQTPKARRRRKNSVSIGDLKGGESKSLPSSVPTLVQRKALNPCLSSGSYTVQDRDIYRIKFLFS